MTALHPEYLDTLLLYFEEEIMGEAYFYGLVDHFNEPHEKEKLVLFAEVERFAAEAVRPLIEKYNLKPRSDEELAALEESVIERHKNYTWIEYISYISIRFPKYMPEFHSLEAMAPPEDLPLLKIFTEHEVVDIEFANRELANRDDSTDPLLGYLGRL